MPGPNHREHDHAIVTKNYNLHNVAYTETHDLVRCAEDRFFGWIPREG